MTEQPWTRRGVSRRTFLRGSVLGVAGLAGAVLIGCGGDDDDQTAATATGTATEAATATGTATEAATATGTATEAATAAATATVAAAAGGDLIVMSNSSPHISVVDIDSLEVTKTVDIPDFTAWTWNDDNNHFDGRLLWLGTKHPDTKEVEIWTLDLDSYEVTNRIAVGPDTMNVYIGKASSNGTVHIGEQGSGEVIPISASSFEVLATWTPPVNGDVVCDADISTGADSVERYVYPTRKGDTIVTLDPVTGDTLSEVATPAGASPLMLTAAPDGRIWVQENGSNTNSVYEPESLELVKRFPAGQVPIVNTFSPDGKLSYVGHGGDPFVQVIDTETLEEVTRVTVGTAPTKLVVHPAGTFIYAILSKEGAIVAVDTSTWEVTKRVALGTDPTGLFLRARV